MDKWHNAFVTSSDASSVEAKIHDWHIAPREYARHEVRRGRRHAYEQLDPIKAVSIVVDMVPFFALENSYARGIVPNINALASALRASCGTVVWVLPKVSPQPSAWALEFYGLQVAASFNASGGQGAPLIACGQSWMYRKATCRPAHHRSVRYSSATSSCQFT